MADLIDLALIGEAKRILAKLIDRRGIRWFMDAEGPRLMALDKAKVGLVVRVAARARARKGHAAEPAAIEHCHKQVRRDLIRRVAMAMLKTGC